MGQPWNSHPIGIVEQPQEQVAFRSMKIQLQPLGKIRENSLEVYFIDQL